MDKANDIETNEVGPMTKRKELMADGRRYIIYYEFDEENEVKEDV